MEHMHDFTTPELSAPELEFVADLHVQVGPPLEIGERPGGHRRIVPILGGDVKGPMLQGRVLGLGADFQVIRPDNVAELHARYVIELSAGGLVYVENTGIRHGPPEAMQRLQRGEFVDPSLIYFRSCPRFETAVPECAWLMQHLYVATGARFPASVFLRFFRLR